MGTVEKICAFSDIHGNAPAFDACYDALVAEAADAYIYLGDLCGYYYQQNEVFSKLQQLPGLLGVLGNHDAIFLSILEGDRALEEAYRETYGRSMKLLKESASDALIRWLRSLPKELSMDHIELYACHGSPDNPLEGYVYPDTGLEGFPWAGRTYYLLGHTHYPMHRRVGGVSIVNPGSVGQPRDGGLPSYAVIDVPAGQVSFRPFAYDRALLMPQIDAAGDNIPYLRDVLSRANG